MTSALDVLKRQRARRVRWEREEVIGNHLAGYRVRGWMGEPRMSKTRRYWEDKAAEARAKAEVMLSEANRQIMFRISRSYERLARIAAEQENNKKYADKSNQ